MGTLMGARQEVDPRRGRVPNLTADLEDVEYNFYSEEDATDYVKGVEWPCEDIIDCPNAPASEWPSLKLSSESVSAEEKEKLASEQKVLEACRNFFHDKYAPELDEEDELTNEDDIEADTEEDTMDCNPGNNEEFKFFIKLFTEDEKLSFYENNHHGGDFCCLVCAAIAKKIEDILDEKISNAKKDAWILTVPISKIIQLSKLIEVHVTQSKKQRFSESVYWLRGVRNFMYEELRERVHKEKTFK
ncbi:hypothetical protein CDL15_Pgr023567 [Punica granatum]|uniref:Uncharacterized protein n=1 Tax=Punica granatum TaxID=22663 RepID=A0A218W950_PUNGR|nr:hypothetical protein CDL15_Pgr023567 [Punica granatum]